MSHARRDVVGDERRHADAEVDVVAVLQLPRDALHDSVAHDPWHRSTIPAGCDSHAAAFKPPRTVRFSIRFSYCLPCEDVLHEDARRDDVVGIELAGLDQLLDLGDRDRARPSPSPD